MYPISLEYSLELDTDIGHVGLSLPWILLKFFFMLSSNNHAGTTLDNEPMPTPVQFLYLSL